MTKKINLQGIEVKADKNELSVKLPPTVWILIWAVAILVVLATVFIVLPMLMPTQDVDLSGATLTSFTKVGEVQLAETTYGGICPLESNGPLFKKTIFAHYRGNATVSMDFNKIELNVDPVKKTITPKFPEFNTPIIEIKDDISYVPNENRILVEDKKKCKEDMENELRKGDILQSTARMNAKSMLEGLIGTIAKKEGYRIVWGSDYE